MLIERDWARMRSRKASCLCDSFHSVYMTEWVLDENMSWQARAFQKKVKYAAALDIETLTVVLLVQTHRSSSFSNSSRIVTRFRSSLSPDLLSSLVLCFIRVDAFHAQAILTGKEERWKD
jgi:hypothetical protein